MTTGALRRVARSTLVQWSPRDTLPRGEYWPAAATLVVLAVVAGDIVSREMSPGYWRSRALVVVYGVSGALLGKLAAWRYCDAGHKWWWGPVQGVVIAVWAVAVAILFVVALATVFAGAHPTGVVWAFFVVVALSLFLAVPAIGVWWLVWSVQPTATLRPIADAADPVARTG